MKSGQPSKRRRRNREGLGQTVAVIAIGAVVAVALFAGAKYFVMQPAPAPLAAKAASGKQALSQGIAHTAAGGSGDEVYTGSILYMPIEGPVCHQLLFDNRNGGFVDNGNVDCAAAAYQGEDGAPKQLSSARTHVISMAFRNR